MEHKICIKCKKDKAISDFYKSGNTAGGYMGCCKECCKKRVRENRNANKEYYRNYDKQRQRKNIKRILSHRYQGIKQRCNGTKNSRHYFVEGMPYLSREEWDKWCKENMDEFMRLYRNWAAMGFPRKLCPSIDRINNKKGYTVDNIRWISLTENSSKYTKDIIPFL